MLLWNLEWGPSLKVLKEMAEKSGIEPRALSSRPSLNRKYQGHLEDFYLLSGRRFYNEAGLQPLQLSEIFSFLTHAGITGPEEKGHHLRILVELDQVFLDYQSEKRKRELEQTKVQ